MTFEQIKELRLREPLIYTPDGSRWFVNGKAQTWKTRPDEIKLPIKHGLWQYGYLTEQNMHDFYKET